MDNKTYKEILAQFTTYLLERKLRRTEERETILRQICELPGHFDIYSLHKQLEAKNFHVSKATLYNTLDVLLEAGVIIRHQINTQSCQYELKVIAENHLHLICSTCGSIKVMKNNGIKTDVTAIKTGRFTQDFFLLYVYGMCNKCRLTKKKKTK